MRYCYERALVRDPDLRGELEVKFVIARDGTVARTMLESTTLGTTAVEQCVLSRFQHLVFSELRGGGVVFVSYPLVFSPRD